MLNDNLLRLGVVFVLVTTFITNLHAQELDRKMEKMLASAWFENVRVKSSNDTLYLSYESNNYRWDVRGLKVVLDSVTAHVSSPVYLEVVTLSNGIPVFETSVYSDDWRKFRNDSMEREQFQHNLSLTYQTDKAWHQLKNQKPVNTDLYKFDLVVYPLFSYTNITFAKIYEVMFALAPALEFSLWKGSKITTQVIFPIYADTLVFSDNYRWIRPGYMALSQKFRLPGPIFGTFSTGIFNQNKWGFDFDFTYPFKNPHWSVGLDIGYTGRTYFSRGTQYLRVDLYLNYLARVSYLWAKYNLQLDLSGGKYIYGDYGVRFDATRHFGETSIGFYAIYAGGKANGGFHFAIPIPPSKRARRLPVRVLPPRYYELQYNGATEYIKGHVYLTSPTLNRSEDYFNLLYIKNSLH